MTATFIRIGTLLDLHPIFQSAATFSIVCSHPDFKLTQRLKVFAIDSTNIDSNPAKTANRIWANARENCGDSPTQYNPKFLMALLASLPVQVHNLTSEEVVNWQIPSVKFSTEESTRLSMTLNGMRMSTEYFASDSTRVLQLVEQRLEAAQSDVIHDILVYLMQRALELSTTFTQERMLLAESIAAYLGVQENMVHQLLCEQLKNELWENRQIQSEPLALKIQNGFAGTPRASADVTALIQNQAARFNEEFSYLKQQHERVFHLIDEIADKIFASGAKS